MTGDNAPSPSTQSQRAFGVANRERLLAEYFAQPGVESVTPETAWRHTYRLLMWVDRTIGLAHCYESDKAQPGRPWYARSLRFHQWLSDQFAVSPRELGARIDWLFTAAVEDLTTIALESQRHRMSVAQSQREPYEGIDMPMPDEDVELEELVTAAVEREFGRQAPAEFGRDLVRSIKSHLSSDNKRKNLVGEGFEDTLAALLRRSEAINDHFDVLVRPSLHGLPGFHPPRGKDKTKKVDLALVARSSDRRILVSCKWSVRSDREEQFTTDFDAYSALESDGRAFEYVLITNEFDPARLSAACEKRSGNADMFNDVVHVAPSAVKEAMSVPLSGNGRTNGGQARVLEHIQTGRLASLENWMQRLIL